jgi:hypothetical protein
VKAYKNEDTICTFLPIFHIVVVQALGTSAVHIENVSGRVTVSGLITSGASDIIGHDDNIERRRGGAQASADLCNLQALAFSQLH